MQTLEFICDKLRVMRVQLVNKSIGAVEIVASMTIVIGVSVWTPIWASIISIMTIDWMVLWHPWIMRLVISSLVTTVRVSVAVACSISIPMSHIVAIWIAHSMVWVS
jgi:hypothetical protein